MKYGNRKRLWPGLPRRSRLKIQRRITCSQRRVVAGSRSGRLRCCGKRVTTSTAVGTVACGGALSLKNPPKQPLWIEPVIVFLGYDSPATRTPHRATLLVPTKTSGYLTCCAPRLATTKLRTSENPQCKTRSSSVATHSHQLAMPKRQVVEANSDRLSSPEKFHATPVANSAGVADLLSEIMSPPEGSRRLQYHRVPGPWDLTGRQGSCHLFLSYYQKFVRVYQCQRFECLHSLNRPLPTPPPATRRSAWPFSTRQL
ncbi:hypothetical protein MTO96_011208 [Rhipicephalus appendiculatus]